MALLKDSPSRSVDKAREPGICGICGDFVEEGQAVEYNLAGEPIHWRRCAIYYRAAFMLYYNLDVKTVATVFRVHLRTAYRIWDVAKEIAW